MGHGGVNQSLVASPRLVPRTCRRRRCSAPIRGAARERGFSFDWQEIPAFGKSAIHAGPFLQRSYVCRILLLRSALFHAPSDLAQRIFSMFLEFCNRRYYDNNIPRGLLSYGSAASLRFPFRVFRFSKILFCRFYICPHLYIIHRSRARKVEISSGR